MKKAKPKSVNKTQFELAKLAEMQATAAAARREAEATYLQAIKGSNLQFAVWTKERLIAADLALDMARMAIEREDSSDQG